MARFQIEEFCDERIVATTSAEVPDALSAAAILTGKAISTKALQEHWFRVVDEQEGTVHEFSIAEEPPKDFCQMTNWLAQSPARRSR
ncbi:MAG: hypothetical protein EOR68_09180 [Mesorhizobium sp.]|uniref:hypothetical protein n=1 Tax=Mesorhizobium sp. TaxID=1871066 RepID=UPI000FE74E75|nr:hypothetical protein [Mesorhizobium sp.]RWM01754.1 MAG: hypothetical protein EOR68_09180 [Mesorhizobium sp.]TIP51276.1 MAG: hypothetical protein E5X77_02665 [Mesorhizobium sp.]